MLQIYHTKVDLKLGFNNINVEESCKPLLSFSYGGSFFVYNVMPLGISSGPYTFDAWAKIFCEIVQTFLLSKVHYYQDDFLLNGSDPLRLFHSTLIFVFLLMFCAKALINWEKSVLVPSIHLTMAWRKTFSHPFQLAYNLNWPPDDVTPLHKQPSRLQLLRKRTRVPEGLKGLMGWKWTGQCRPHKIASFLKHNKCDVTVLWHITMMKG